jgi:phosphate/sulfate permease
VTYSPWLEKATAKEERLFLRLFGFSAAFVSFSAGNDAMKQMLLSL